MKPFQATPSSPVVHNYSSTTPPLEHRPFSDPSRLAPEDAFLANSPPRRYLERESIGGLKAGLLNGDAANTGVGVEIRRPRERGRGRSASRKRKHAWKKLLWVKQGYPDNYTDEPTFLSHLQRNPRLLPYDFWPLVADSTVIVQHVCSVAIFVCSFVGIYQERVSPVSVVSWGTAGTILGWVLWDFWIGQEEARTLIQNITADRQDEASGERSSVGSPLSGSTSTVDTQGKELRGLGLSLATNSLPSSQTHSRSISVASLTSMSSTSSPIAVSNPNNTPQFANPSFHPHRSHAWPFSPRNQQRLATAKSAVLIYCALLGLSPILKSLTKSTTSDSIWAMSCWLMAINVFFFDYGGGVGVKFPASLSTNAALMASTVLASRLPSTTHVFSLTLFSIEVFGLFPVFRRHLRHRSWLLHLALTISLIVGAGAGMGVKLANGGEGGGWKAAVVGVVLWGLGTTVGMGGCSWWFIGLQRYKNVIIGQWDVARPVIKRAGSHWE